MSPGKIAAQAGHCFIDCAAISQSTQPQLWADYKQNHGIKIVMRSRSLKHLEQAYADACLAGIPAALITDLGYYGVAPGLEGKAVITALGIGPARRSDLGRILKRFQLMN